MKKWSNTLLLSLFFVISLKATISNKYFKDIKPYQIIKPYHAAHLKVSDLHSIYYAEYGNPDGIPVIVSHGGPGSSCNDTISAAFNPEVYHVIMFDQRGAGKSKPFANMHENTPQHSVADMEKLREHLGIDTWIVFGGSYGSLLSVLYAQTHPDRARGLVLRGIFLGTKHEYEHLLKGMKLFFPKQWQEMVDLVPKDERSDLITALHKQVMSSDPAIYQPASNAFMYYDFLSGTLGANPDVITIESLDKKKMFSITRAYMHYAVNNFFLNENQLLDNMDKIAHIPGIIVHGRYDLICPPKNAYDLHEKWPNAKLWFLPDSGHLFSEHSMTRGLCVAMDKIQNMITQE